MKFLTTQITEPNGVRGCDKEPRKEVFTERKFLGKMKKCKVCFHHKLCQQIIEFNVNLWRKRRINKDISNAIRSEDYYNFYDELRRSVKKK